MNFRNQQEYLRYLRSKPVEPERYEEPKKQSEPQAEEEGDGEVLQAD